MNNPPESIFVDTGFHWKDFSKKLEFESEMAKKQISLGDLLGNNMTFFNMLYLCAHKRFPSSLHTYKKKPGL
jgi:hypothetical protein